MIRDCLAILSLALMVSYRSTFLDLRVVRSVTGVFRFVVYRVLKCECLQTYVRCYQRCGYSGWCSYDEHKYIPAWLIVRGNGIQRATEHSRWSGSYSSDSPSLSASDSSDSVAAGAGASSSPSLLPKSGSQLGFSSPSSFKNPNWREVIEVFDDGIAPMGAKALANPTKRNRTAKRVARVWDAIFV